ncbi:MAG: DNA/RNA non-specific endonuclease [Reichenbachiella sp.]
MARAKAKPSKKKAPEKKQGNSSSITNIVIILVVAVLIYGFYEMSKHTTFDAKPLSGDILSNKKTNSQETKAPTPQPKAIPKSIPKKLTETKTSTKERLVETVETNEDLPQYESEDEVYFARSFDFTWPSYDQADQIIEHEFYTLKYNEKTEQADWVAYKVKGSDLANAKYKRKDNFRADPNVKTKSAHPTDYKGSGFDRGHLAPAADFTWTETGLDESFYMSNMSPQAPGFNRGIWKKLETKVRVWANENQIIYVVTGPIYTEKSEKIGKNKVAIPDKYYKVVLELTGKEKKGIAFIMDNEKTSMPLSEFAMSINDIERILDMDFFPAIPDNIEDDIESKYDYSAW